MRRVFYFFGCNCADSIAYPLESRCRQAFLQQPGLPGAWRRPPTSIGQGRCNAVFPAATLNLGDDASPRVLAWNPNNALIAWYRGQRQPLPI